MFPADDEHCAYFAAETLQKSLQVYMRKQTAPVKNEPAGISPAIHP